MTRIVIATVFGVLFVVAVVVVFQFAFLSTTPHENANKAFQYIRAQKKYMLRNKAGHVILSFCIYI